MEVQNRSRWLRSIALVLLGVVVVAQAGCIFGDHNAREGLFEGQGSLSEDEIEEIEEDIQKLGNASDMERDPDAEAEFWDAVQRLTAHGAVVEPYLLEALAADEDWAVRYGAIHVIDSVGTKDAVEPLIRSLDDEHYLVSFKAVHTLRVFTDHREIPESAEDAVDGGLPPVGEVDPDDLDVEAGLKPWIRWHLQHATALRDAWLKWWGEHGHHVAVD